MRKLLSTVQILVSFTVLGLSLSSHADVGDEKRQRYGLSSASQKLIDNRGDGFEPLYGTRNVRAVLNGVFYRGGANNYYHRSKKRANQNPLPSDGLENLCQEGFTAAVYLYTTNYGSSPKSVRCTTYDGRPNQLEYHQLSILSAGNNEIHSLLTMILEHVRNPSLGGLYAHCWNGWHASGITAAYALRQFCGFSGEEAVAYWNVNTDGNNDASYNGIRQKIRGFVPFGDLNLTGAERASLCPDSRSLSF